MQREHGHAGILDHALGDTRLEHADERNVMGKLCGIELIDSRPHREDELEIGKRFRDVVRRHPGYEIAHLCGIADVRPEPER